MGAGVGDESTVSCWVVQALSIPSMISQRKQTSPRVRRVMLAPCKVTQGVGGTQWRIYAKWRPWQSLNVRPFIII